MSEDTHKKRISISPSRTLDVELMEFQYMPGIREVSLCTKGIRIVNMEPRTSLNLLAWLQEHQEQLEQLAGDA